MKHIHTISVWAERRFSATLKQMVHIITKTVVILSFQHVDSDHKTRSACGENENSRSLVKQMMVSWLYKTDDGVMIVITGSHDEGAIAPNWCGGNKSDEV
jgi:hypothetical protein